MLALGASRERRKRLDGVPRPHVVMCPCVERSTIEMKDDESHQARGFGRQSEQRARREQLREAIDQEEARLAKLEAEQADSDVASRRCEQTWPRSAPSRTSACTCPWRSTHRFRERRPKR